MPTVMVIQGHIKDWNRLHKFYDGKRAGKWLQGTQILGDKYEKTQNTKNRSGLFDTGWLFYISLG